MQKVTRVGAGDQQRHLQGGEVVLPETWVPGDVRPSVCAPGCCPNLRAVKPALCGSD